VSSTHALPRAERRRQERNTRVEGGFGAADKALAEQAALTAVAASLESFWVPACLVCCRETKRVQREHQLAVDIATKAAEPVPDVPQVSIRQAFTIDPARGPVCWEHVEGALDEDMTLNERRMASGLPPLGFPEADQLHLGGE
jgi:hypothetical protein